MVIVCASHSREVFGSGCRLVVSLCLFEYVCTFKPIILCFYVHVCAYIWYPIRLCHPHMLYTHKGSMYQRVRAISGTCARLCLCVCAFLSELACMCGCVYLCLCLFIVCAYVCEYEYVSVL